MVGNAYLPCDGYDCMHRIDAIARNVQQKQNGRRSAHFDQSLLSERFSNGKHAHHVLQYQGLHVQLLR